MNKILDLIGDSYLLGHRIKGHLIASKSGHESNVEFIKYIHNNHRVFLYLLVIVLSLYLFFLQPLSLTMVQQTHIGQEIMDHGG